MSAPSHVILSEDARRGDETGAGLMKNRCAFTSKDMAATFGDAFTYAIVCGWDDEDGTDASAMREVAEEYGWDEPLIAFLRDAHARFCELATRRADQEGAQ